MCAILDANVVHEVFGVKQSPAGKEFYQWIYSPKETNFLVVGDKLLGELERASGEFRERTKQAFQHPLQQAFLTGRIKKISDGEESKIEAREKNLRKECVSNDAHIIALAQVSGARLLCSNDRDLHKDFKNKGLIDGPRGRVYSTFRKSNTRNSWIKRKNLCAGCK